MDKKSTALLPDPLRQEKNGAYREERNMKKHAAVMLILVTTLFTTGVIVPVAYGQEKGKQEGAAKEFPFTVKRLVAGTGVENSEPVGVAETFPMSTEKVYCFLEAADIAKDMEVSFVWSYGEKEMLKTILPIKAGAKWRTYANKNLRGMKGEWKVEIKDSDGKVLKELRFKVE
jgi:hypothetical protein